MLSHIRRWLVTPLLLAGCASFGASAPITALDRIDGWESVEGYNYEAKVFGNRYAAWAHEPGNEAKSKLQAEAALGIKDPDPAAALKAALRIARANPKDDLGFMAISFCLYSGHHLDEAGGSGGQAYVTPALQLLDRYYLNDLRLTELILGIARMGGKDGITLLDKVVDKSNQRTLRAQAAFFSATERLMQVDDITRAPAERSVIRADVTRLAKLVADQYGDVPVFGRRPAAEQIKPVLYALEHLAVGSVLPDITAVRIGGGDEHLSDYRGKVVLLDFWATWCASCVASLPKVVKLKHDLEGRPFEVITLSIDEAPKAVQDFMKKRMDLPFVNWHIGAESEIYRTWGAQGVPTYFLLDKNGVLQDRTYELDSLLNMTRQLAGS
jgi:thiol-disulfide isomerase/thioredoxin